MTNFVQSCWAGVRYAPYQAIREDQTNHSQDTETGQPCT